MALLGGEAKQDTQTSSLSWLRAVSDLGAEEKTRKKSEAIMTRTPTAEEVLGLYREWQKCSDALTSLTDFRNGALIRAMKMNSEAVEKFHDTMEQWQAATRTENSKRFIVQLELGVWLARWDGDPGRTMHIENSRWFETREEAEEALREARRCRPFANGRVLQLAVEE